MLDHPELGEWSARRAIQLPGSSGRSSKRPFQTGCWAKGVDRCTRLSTNSTTASDGGAQQRARIDYLHSGRSTAYLPTYCSLLES